MIFGCGNLARPVPSTTNDTSVQAEQMMKSFSATSSFDRPQSVFVLGLLLAAVTHTVVHAQQSQANRDVRLAGEVQISRDIPYTADGHKRQKLDLYVPQRKDGGKPPLVIWIHGGGWALGSKNNIGNCRWVLAEGYALASVGYRLTDVAAHPAQLNDCKTALRWLKENADQYGYDASRIVVWGASAGGHLVALLGTTGNPTDPADDIAGVVDWFGPAELLTMQAQRTLPTRLNADAPDSFESRLVGGPLQERRNVATSASPVTHVTADDAPFLIMHGDKDALVSISQSRTLNKKLTAAGVESELVVLEGAGHGGPAFNSERARDRILAFIDRCTKAAPSTDAEADDD
jgi:acetyl esterase/lipase